MCLEYDINKSRFLQEGQGLPNLGLNLDTPNFIIQDMAESALLKIDTRLLSDPVYRAKIILSIKRQALPPIKEPFSDPDLVWIASFLNPEPELEWDVDVLESVFRRVYELMLGVSGSGSGLPPNQMSGGSSNTKFELPPNIEWGPPRPETSHKVPYFVLYKFLLRTNPHLIISHNTTPQQLIAIYQMSAETENNLRHRLHYQINQMTHQQLVGMLAIAETAEGDRTGFEGRPVQSRTASPQPGAGSRSASPLSTDPATPREAELQIGDCLTPLTDQQAVTYALQYQKRDITNSCDPKAEYLAYKLGQPLRDPYMRQIQTLNPLAYDIRNTFNPNIPAEYYSKLSIVHGIGYEDLMMIGLTDSFHLGICHGVTNFKTCIELEDLRRLDPLPPTITFGSRSTKLTPYMVREICDTFEANQAFANPEGGFFTQEAIEHLLHLIKLVRSKRTFRRTYDGQNPIWLRLHNVIKLVKTYQSGKHAYCTQLGKMWYGAPSPRYKQTIKFFFDHLLKMGMLMRGWREDEKDLPVGVVPTSNEYITNQLVSDEFVILDEFIGRSDPELIEFLLSLPLLKFSGNDFHPSTNAIAGLTLGERLNIIKIGDTDDNIHSCVRTSSNWIIWTVYRYLTVIGHQPDFNIGDLRQIH